MMSDQPAPAATAPEDAPSAFPPKSKDTVGAGFRWMLLCQALHVVGGAVTMPIGLGAVALAAFGVAQLVYVVPLAIRAKRQGQSARMKGMIIAASLAFLLNASCWGVLIAGLSSTSFH